MKVATGPWSLTQKEVKGVYELVLQDLLVDKLKEIFKDYSLLAKNGTLQEVQVFPQFLPQPEGVTIREKKSDYAIVPQGYEVEDIESLFPCVLVKVEGSRDNISRSLRKSQIDVKIIAGTYDNTQDCQGYRDVLNIMSKIRLELLTLPGYVLDERFRLSNDLMNMQLFDDREWPYFFATIETVWEAAQPLNINYF